MNQAGEVSVNGMVPGMDGKPLGGRARVLFVDHSVVLRTALKELFKTSESLEAFTSSPAVDVTLLNVAKARPHLVVIDADRPWEEVASLVTAVKAEHRSLSLVLLTANQTDQSRLAQKGQSIGVAACWIKSNGFRNPDGSVRQYLVQQTAIALGTTVQTTMSPESSASASPVALKKLQTSASGQRSTKKSVIVIGVSTGGPDALSVLLPLLPADLSVPVLIVQHTLAAFTSLLVERLQKRTTLTVLEAQEGTPVLSGRILVAPGNRHMQVAVRNGQVVTLLDEGPPENSCRPAVDPLFRSAARVYGAHTLGIVLTGMGQDGLLGSRDLKRAGATIVAQDEASSTVWGMPGQVAQAGLADFTLDLKEIASEIVRQTGMRPRARLQL